MWKAIATWLDRGASSAAAAAIPTIRIDPSIAASELLRALTDERGTQ
jgi:hypothetical protein